LKKLLFIFFLISIGLGASAQTDSSSQNERVDTVRRAPRPIKKPVVKPIIRRATVDTLKRTDTLVKRNSIAAISPDTSRMVVFETQKLSAAPAVPKKPIDSFYLKILDNPYLRTTGKPLYFVVNERTPNSKDEIFYLLAALILFLAFIRLAFSQYFKNIFRLFFEPTFRQKQTREQLLQNTFPSFLLNLFFIVSSAAYITFVISHLQLTHLNFWLLLAYSTIALLILYIGKFLLLTFAGWVFDVKQATDTYIFAVYLINKILGVVLIPFTLVIAFSRGSIIDHTITISLLIIAILFIYRFLVSFAPVQREIKVTPFHFLFYFFAFEIVPLLLIYKTLIIYLNNSV
jgi:hypothetical protein